MLDATLLTSGRLTKLPNALEGTGRVTGLAPTDSWRRLATAASVVAVMVAVAALRGPFLSALLGAPFTSLRVGLVLFFRALPLLASHNGLKSALSLAAVSLEVIAEGLRALLRIAAECLPNFRTP